MYANDRSCGTAGRPHLATQQGSYILRHIRVAHLMTRRGKAASAQCALSRSTVIMAGTIGAVSISMAKSGASA